MAINVATLAPASVKSKNVATEQYVDTSIASIDVSGDINANNDVFAQKLGYTNYAAMVNAAASGQTVINGGYINTGLIQAEAITADKIDANAISGKTISGGIITGTKLYGTQIEGAIIKASYIDLSSTATLTNWQQYTPANYPSAYDSNFAKNNNGTLLVDSQGYVRLMGNTKIVNGGKGYGSHYLPNSNYTPAVTLPSYVIDIHSYDDYKNNSVNRMIASSHTLSIPSVQKFTIASLEGIINTGTSCTCSLQFYVFEDYYDCYIYGAATSRSELYGVNAYIKKNGTIVASTTANYASISYTFSMVGIPFTITLRTGAYGGISLIVSSTNNVSTSTPISVSGVYGPMLNVISGYCSARMHVSIDIPVLTIV